jgi:hypothetical protein
MEKELENILTTLNFKKSCSVSDRTSIVDLFSPARRCGIYVLHFENGEVYAGQAVDVTRRFIQHRRKHKDISEISFKPVTLKKINEAERETIWELEKASIPLRNITFTSVLGGETDFDLIMNPKEQERWLGDVTWSDLKGTRTNDRELRRKYGMKFQTFLQEPDVEIVQAILKIYIKRCIPVPVRSELSFWAVSCLPRYSVSGISVYSRININWQEVFTVSREGGIFGFSWHLAMSPLQEAYGSNLTGVARDHPNLSIGDHFYEPGGHDQKNIFTESIDEAVSLLSNPVILKAIRLFNLRLMRKGPTSYNRFHCFDLADSLLTP